MREWLTVIIALLILAVVLDGVRRMRQARRSNIRMRLSMHQGTSKEDLETYGSELPNGGARVANVRKEDDARQLYRQMRQSQEEKKRRLGRPTRIPQQVALNLDEQVPTLMEVEPDTAAVREPSPTYETGGITSRAPTRREPAPQTGDLDREELEFGNGRVEPRFSDVMDDPAPTEETSGGEGPLGATSQETDSQETDSQETDSQETDSQETEQGEPERYGAYPHDAEHYGAGQYEAKQYGADQYEADQYEADPHEADDGEEDDEAEEDFREPEVVLVINVMAPKGERFRGDELLETALARGMRFGGMDIFHHHERPNGDGGVLYSMANIVMPGTFDLATMKTFTTPGVSLFLALPLEGEADSGKAFETMLTTAKTLASTLGGELKDENRSVLTAQTVTHYRGRIKEFERKRLSKTPA